MNMVRRPAHAVSASTCMSQGCRRGRGVGRGAGRLRSLRVVWWAALCVVVAGCGRVGEPSSVGSVDPSPDGQAPRSGVELGVEPGEAAPSRVPLQRSEARALDSGVEPLPVISRNGIFVIDAESGTVTDLIFHHDFGDSRWWLSPDGSRIAYGGDSGLWLADSDGSNQVQLPDSIANDSWPGRVSWYPDSSALVYTGEAGSFVVDSTGHNQVEVIKAPEATDVRDPVILLSSATTEITFMTHEGLFTVSADGTNQRRVIEFAGPEYPYATANRQTDATHVYFLRDDGFWLADIDGSNQRVLATWGVLQAQWSPAGTGVAFCGRQGSFVADIHTSAPTRVDHSLAVTCTQFGPIWSQDSSHVAFGLYEDLLVAQSDGSRPQLLTTNRLARDPRWSPDGSKVAYGTNVTDLQSGTTFVVGLVESWSPDGSRMIYRPLRDKGDGVHIADSDGNNSKQISTHHMAAPVWSPDGRFIAYNDREGYFVTDPSANDTRQLSPQHYQTMGWSDDGTQLAYQLSSRRVRSTDRYGTDAESTRLPPGIFVTNAGGGAPQPLVELDGHFEATIEWLPDGKHLIFERWSIAE